MEKYDKHTDDDMTYQVIVQDVNTATKRVDTDKRDPNYADTINYTKDDGSRDTEFALHINGRRFTTASELDGEGIRSTNFDGGWVTALETFAQNYIKYKHEGKAIEATKQAN